MQTDHKKDHCPDRLSVVGQVDTLPPWPTRTANSHARDPPESQFIILWSTYESIYIMAR